VLKLEGRRHRGPREEIITSQDARPTLPKQAIGGLVIDGALVNGSAQFVATLAGVVRRLQTGYLYSYAFWMTIGLALLLAWFLILA
jgi:hypothetical protein